MRLFVAYDLPEEVLTHMVEIQSLLLDPEMIRCRKVKQAQMHITLQFLGEQSEQTLAQILELFAKVKFGAFSGTLTHLGVFPNPMSPRIVWAGIHPTEPSESLHHGITDALKPLNIADSAKFKPHLTLARIISVSNANRFYKTLKEIKIKPLEFTVSCFKLYRSILLPQGPEYSVLKVFDAQSI